MDFGPFDQRGYRTVDVETGYAAWSTNYERTVQDEMDLRLLERAASVPWKQLERALDLACGTGRTGAWLKQAGVRHIDGVDRTEAMLALARGRQVYAELHRGDVRETGLRSGTYDLAIQVLADEHLPDLAPLYAEAARLTTRAGRFVLVGYHPLFLLMGIPTHFDDADGEPVAIESYVHLFRDHFRAARGAGWQLAELDEGVIDEAWLAKKPKWAKYRDRPVSFLMAWEKTVAAD